ncbi:hypothetical protein H5410_028660 [Solanum commersonii]|uniref:DUF4283 domain-containing protein n=1 Tax=Solanum commersonii TaxID=4109 RepID=A0A9J5Z5G2_SOLCO|nr:hypothetical protein H5410_028660 [Solanum commersonii]
MNTLEGDPHTVARNTGKEKSVVVEQWPELSKYSDKGTGSQQDPMKTNGTVTHDKIANNTKRKLDLNETETCKPWANLFATNRLAGRGMNLSYIPPVIVEGEKVVTILPEDDEKWGPSIIAYVVGTTPSIGVMERFILAQGVFSTKPVILVHIDGYFVVRFVNKGSHYMMRRPIIMKPWVPEFNFKEEILTTIPIWIKLPNLPLNCWNPTVLSKIGSRLGKPLYADECTTQASRISFARILVEVDVTRPLPKTIKIHDPKGRVMEQQIWYDWKPKGTGHGQMKEWIPIKDKQEGNETNQVGKQAQIQDEDQTKEVEHEGAKTVQVQEQWQIVRSKSFMRRGSDIRQGIQEELGANSNNFHFDEGSHSGETNGGREGIPKFTLKP